MRPWLIPAVAGALSLSLLGGGVALLLWMGRPTPPPEEKPRGPETVQGSTLPRLSDPEEWVKVLTTQIVDNRWWKKPPTREEVRQLAKKICEQQSDIVVYVNDQANVLLKSFSRYDKRARAMQMGQSPDRVNFQRFIIIDLDEFKTRPDEVKVLLRIDAALRQAEFNEPTKSAN